MKKYYQILTIFLCCSSYSYSELSWLEGNWYRKSKKGTVVESWNKINNQLFKGKSILKSQSQEKLLEELYLIKMQAGWFYLAKPVDNSLPTPFKQVKIAKNYISFENKKYDFPQRIEYQFQGKNLSIKIEGVIDKAKKSFSLVYSKKQNPNK